MLSVPLGSSNFTALDACAPCDTYSGSRPSQIRPLTVCLPHCTQTLYAFKSDDPEDLTFEANEIIRVYDWEDEWFEGETQDGKRG